MKLEFFLIELSKFIITTPRLYNDTKEHDNFFILIVSILALFLHCRLI